MSIGFVYEDVRRPRLKYKCIKLWLKYIIKDKGLELGNLCYIFCSDEFLKDINFRFLQHDYYTDVVTFDYCENNFLSGDVFISIERVKDNSIIFGSGIEDEFLRVIVHGLLHLMGYKDSNEDEKFDMRNMENNYLDLYRNFKDEVLK